jgi:hypothetical protein
MHSICDPSKVRFTGPLAPFASGLAAELEAMGYATTSAANQLRLAAHLSRWLEAQHLEPGDLTGRVIDRFVVARRRTHTNLYSCQALGPILGYLRRVNAAPLPSLPSLSAVRIPSGTVQVPPLPDGGAVTDSCGGERILALGPPRLSNTSANRTKTFPSRS